MVVPQPAVLFDSATAEGRLLDEAHPDWGASPYFNVTLTGRQVNMGLPLWPGDQQANPYLPLNLQREHAMPGAERNAHLHEVQELLHGLMARTVLEHWGIHATQDLGDIVFALVECGILIKQEDDRKEDFRAVFDFEEAFELGYPWGAKP